MKRALMFVLALVAAYVATEYSSPVGHRTPSSDGAGPAIEQVIGSQRSGVQVAGSGAVARILADDNDGSRHQRFILRLDSGQTLLVAHNIDLAPRVSGLQVGERVRFYGVYEWNDRGGVIHWTHHDPAGHHVAGWLEHDGIRYQ